MSSGSGNGQGKLPAVVRNGRKTGTTAGLLPFSLLAMLPAPSLGQDLEGTSMALFESFHQDINNMRGSLSFFRHAASSDFFSGIVGIPGEDLAAAIEKYNQIVQLFMMVLEGEDRWTELPRSLIKAVTEAANRLRNDLMELKEIRAKAAAESRVESLLSNLVPYYQDVFNAVMPAFPILQDPTAVITPKAVRERIDTEMEPFRKEMLELTTSAEATKQRLESYIGRAGIKDHAKVFRDAAAEYEKKANEWLKKTEKAAGGTGFVLIVIVLISVFSAPTNWWQFAQAAVAKVVLVSFCISVVLWCGRIYKSMRHNEIVNAHRAHALETFEIFAKAAESDPAVKNAILQQATNTIFTAAPTGMIGDESDVLTVKQILDVVKSVPGKSGGSGAAV